MTIQSRSGDHQDHGHAVERLDLLRIAFVLLAAAAMWFQPSAIQGHARIGGWVAIVIGGYPIFMEAAESLGHRRMTMELSMTLALVCAAAIGEFFTALVITLFVLVAEILEGLTVGRGRHAIEDLLDVLPRTVLLRRGGTTETVPLEGIAVDEVLLVN
ncbi:MAG TPA: hypothetical protein VFF76_00200, partial [Holophagaceae bacterium]|nr:hypothetical protein [Holophagaceae bacterium]